MIQYKYIIKQPLEVIPHSVIAILTSKKGEFAQRIAYVEIATDIWAMGSPEMKNVLLV
jgi:hypothetical protein